MIPVSAVAVCGACTIPTSGVLAAGNAPTGVAPGVTLYYFDAEGRPVPELRETGHLGTVAEALDLLLRSTPPPGLYSELPSGVAAPRPLVTEFDDRITVHMPYTAAELTEPGVSQLVCTALGVHRQAGRGPATVVLIPTIGDRIGPRDCPVQR
ncbi:hypothetical protein [Nocardia transvalensis]|uniref:hypothetical protein n=1 Tax=Nocardia transvalensis TaxID=37333 RepID=UPI0018955860|nr:hypothetical protein [Nocardia transvalensis]MBF6330787.1 hypothetical protein [Nocardia transvalensis]